MGVVPFPCEGAEPLAGLPSVQVDGAPVMAGGEREMLPAAPSSADCIGVGCEEQLHGSCEAAAKF